MKLIPLTNSDKIVWVGDEDYHLVSQHKWRISTYGYVVTTCTRRLRIHRMILGVIDPKIDVDHINHDKCNNLRSNIRIATRKQNQYNQLPQTGCASKYKGVTFHKVTSKWQAKITKDKKEIYIGLFLTEEDAAKAYNLKAIELFGEFACLNNVDQSAFIIPDKKARKKTSRFRGVYLRGGKWMVSVYVNGKGVYVKPSKTEIEAATRYNEIIVRHFGEHDSRLNILA